MIDKTSMYSLKEFNDSKVSIILDDVVKALEERDYNATNQLVGYLMSGDPGYISSYKDARKKITSVDRSLIIEYLLKYKLGDK